MSARMTVVYSPRTVDQLLCHPKKLDLAYSDALGGMQRIISIPFNNTLI